MTLATPPLGKFLGYVRTDHGNTLSNLKSVVLTVLELLAVNAQKFRGSLDHDYAPFWKNFRASCPDCAWKHVCQI